VLSFLTAFVLLAPVKFLVRTFLPSQQVGVWKLDNLSGNLWQGTMQVGNQKGVNTQLAWQVNITNLLGTDSVMAIDAETERSSLTIHSSFQGLSPAFSLQGQIDSQEISRQLKLPNNAGMTGNIDIKELIVKNKPPYYVASGDAVWAGGYVSANGKRNSLPALLISITPEQDDLNIQLNEQATDINLIKIVATSEKQAKIQIAQRLLKLTKQGALSDNERDYVIRFTEKLKLP